MNNKIRKNTKWILLGLIAIILASCNSTPPTQDVSMAGTYAAQTLAAMPTETEAPQMTEEAEPTPTEIEMTATATMVPEVGPLGPEDFPEDVNPLTGLRVSDPSILDRRPVFVKVANYPASGRPHAGLSFADIVFEYYIGYGGNRFMALFYGQDSDKIGPMRSGRLVDPQIVSLYEGVLGFESAYVTILDHINEILGNRALNGAAGICPAICDDGRNIVTSVFGNSGALTELAGERGVENKRYTLNGMAFDPDAPEGGEDGQQATILYSSANRGEWRFDEDSGLYLRWIEDPDTADLEMIPLVDRNTEEQLAFSNVVVLFASYTEFTASMHDVDIWNSTGQRAVVFRDGQAYDITWSTPDKNQPIQFIDESGEIFRLKPGNTWVAIFGVNSGVSEDDGLWTFNFRLP